jgi:hypothetical protein
MSHHRKASLGVFAAAILIGHANAEDEISCDKSPISYDLSGYSAEIQQSCEVHHVSAEEFDRAAANEMLEAFGAVFTPREWTTWTCEFGGDGQHYGFVHLSRGKKPLSLTSKDIHAAIEATVRMELFSKTPGRVEWHGATEVAGYAVEFYYSEQNGLFGAVPSECLFFSRYTDGNLNSHRSRIVGTYCEVAAGEPLGKAEAAAAIAGIRYRPELLR